MNTKPLFIAGLAAGLALPFCQSAMANDYTLSQTMSVNTTIPDDNLSGVASSMSVNSLIAQQFTTIDSVTVNVNVAASPTAWDGDFYAYLQFGPDLCVLLNNLGAPPYGSPGNGFNVTFSDAAGVQDINTVAGLNTVAPLNGTYTPQVGNLDMFDALSSPVGTWTLYIADTSPGDVGKLLSWNLTVNGTPDEGGTFLLMSLGLGFLGLYYARQPRLARVPVSRD